MRILLDENMPRKFGPSLSNRRSRGLGESLQLAGIDNGALYQMAASSYDLCFTRDAEFSRRVLSKPAARLKLVHVIILQTRQDESVQQFLTAFREADWSSHKSGDDWPLTEQR